MRAFVRVCLRACLPACLPACVPASVPACVRACVRARIAFGTLRISRGKHGIDVIKTADTPDEKADDARLTYPQKRAYWQAKLYPVFTSRVIH